MSGNVNFEQETSDMSILAKHPLLVFGLGCAAGFYVHKYRKEIIEAAVKGAEEAKQTITRQREHLEEVVTAKHH